MHRKKIPGPQLNVVRQAVRLGRPLLRQPVINRVHLHLPEKDPRRGQRTPAELKHPDHGTLQHKKHRHVKEDLPVRAQRRDESHQLQSLRIFPLGAEIHGKSYSYS